jgi:hypothetical protein
MLIGSILHKQVAYFESFLGVPRADLQVLTTLAVVECPLTNTIIGFWPVYCRLPATQQKQSRVRQLLCLRGGRQERPIPKPAAIEMATVEVMQGSGPDLESTRPFLKNTPSRSHVFGAYYKLIG